MTFLECTVVVNLPTLAIAVNLQHVAMCWLTVNDTWVVWVTRMLGCKVASLSTITEFQQQFYLILGKNLIQNIPLTVLTYFVKE
jgi:hypothetical protein